MKYVKIRIIFNTRLNLKWEENNLNRVYMNSGKNEKNDSTFISEDWGSPGKT